MNWQFFMFLVFMSIASFCMAFVLYAAITRLFDGTVYRKWMQVILVPLGVVAFDMAVIVVPDKWRYIVGAIPILLIGALLLYFRFVKGGDLRTGSEAPDPLELSRRTAAMQNRSGDRKTKRQLATEKRQERKEMVRALKADRDKVKEE